MSKPTLVSVNRAIGYPPSGQWAHDLRNVLATLSLHVETLSRFAGARGERTAEAALIMMRRMTALCNEAVMQSVRPDQAARRRGFDVVRTIEEVIAVLRPVAPEGFAIGFSGEDPCIALADPQDTFRILFNLVHNALGVARRGGRISHVHIAIAREGSTVSLRVADDGPGLPKSVQARLYGPQPRAAAKSGGSGLGLAICRELVERNGGALRLTASDRGAAFVVELAGVATVGLEPGATMPSIGKRIARV